MVPRKGVPSKGEDDFSSSTNSSLPWLAEVGTGSWSDDEENASPLMESNDYNLPLHTTTTLSNLNPLSPSRSKGKRQSKSDYDLKNARDVLVGSTSAVINFLRSAGVPKPSADQLEKNLQLGRYFAVLKRVQDYIMCIPSTLEDEKMAKIHLAVSAWEALCRLKGVEYKRAYKTALNLRYELASEETSRFGLKRIRTEMKKATEVQVKLAEQCTACQKNLYLVQKWQQKQLRLMKRVSLIEPEGYEPIRCL